MMTALTPLAWSFASMLVVRIIFGFFEGCMIPAATRCVSMWVTPKERGLATGMWLGAVPMGVVLGNPISGLLIAQWGWPSAFYTFGAIGVFAAYLIWTVIRNRPEEHPQISKIELDIIKTSIVKHEGAARVSAAGSTVMQLLRDPWVWVISLLFASSGSLFWINLSWLPTYFMKARGSGLLKSGFISAIPWIAGALAAPTFGWLSGHFGKTRSIWLAVAYIATAPFLIYGCLAESIYVCLFCFIVNVFLNLGCLSILFALPMEIFPSIDAAKVTGIVNGWATAAGVVSPTAVGFIVQYTNSFNAAYYVSAIWSVGVGLLALAVVVKEKAIRHQRSLEEQLS